MRGSSINNVASLLSPPSLASELRHSWLLNEVLNKTPEVLAELLFQTPWPALEECFPIRVEQTRQLARALELYFGPAQLVDRVSVLASLPGSSRRWLQEAVHKCYCERSRIRALEEPLVSVLDELDQALTELRCLSSQLRDDDWRRRIEDQWSDVLGHAAELHRLLDQLPRRIELP